MKLGVKSCLLDAMIIWLLNKILLKIPSSETSFIPSVEMFDDEELAMVETNYARRRGDRMGEPMQVSLRIPAAAPSSP